MLGVTKEGPRTSTSHSRTTQRMHPPLRRAVLLAGDATLVNTRARTSDSG